VESPAPQPVRWWGILLLGIVAACFASWFALDVFFPGRWGRPLPAGGLGVAPWVRAISVASTLAIPFFISFFPLYAFTRGVKVYEEFVEGAKEGFNVAVRIIPYLVAILVAVGMFRAAGGIEMLAHWLAPVLDRIGFPGRSAAGGARAASKRECHDRAFRRIGKGARAGQLHCAHGRDHHGQHGDDLLCAGGLLRLGRHPPDPARRAGGIDGGSDGRGGLLHHLPGCLRQWVNNKKAARRTSAPPIVGARRVAQ